MKKVRLILIQIIRIFAQFKLESDTLGQELHSEKSGSKSRAQYHVIHYHMRPDTVPPVLMYY